MHGLNDAIFIQWQWACQGFQVVKNSGCCGRNFLAECVRETRHWPASSFCQHPLCFAGVSVRTVLEPPKSHQTVLAAGLPCHSPHPSFSDCTISGRSFGRYPLHSRHSQYSSPGKYSREVCWYRLCWVSWWGQCLFFEKSSKKEKLIIALDTFNSRLFIVLITIHSFNILRFAPKTC